MLALTLGSCLCPKLSQSLGTRAEFDYIIRRLES